MLLYKMYVVLKRTKGADMFIKPKFEKFKSKKAFTLAEVLITLGIVGVVVAMTIPTLINNYQKKLAVTRLEHFSSMMQQAAKMRSKDIIEGDFVEMEIKEVRAYNPDDMEKFYKQYWLPYVKTVNMTKLTKGLLVEYANGSGAYFQKVYLAPDEKDVTNNSYIIFCPEYKYCKDIDVTNAKSAVDARHTFSLWNGGTVPLEFTSVPYSREQLIYKCKTNKYYCASLIYFDGWQISKDYPW